MPLVNFVVRRQVVFHLIQLMLGVVGGSGSALLLNIYLARVLSVEDYGVFYSAQTFAVALSLLIGFGFSQYILAVFGEKKYEASLYIRPLFKLLLLNAIVFLAIYLIMTFNLSESVVESYVLWLLIPFALGQVGTEVVATRLQIDGGYSKLAMWQFLPHTARLSFVLICGLFYQKVNIQLIAAMYGCIGLCTFLFGLVVLRSLCDRGVDQKRVSTLNDVQVFVVLRGLAPYGVAAVLGYTYSQGNILMVRYLAEPYEAGLFSVVLTIVNSALLIPVVVFHKYLAPQYHNWAFNDKEKLRSAFSIANITMLFLGLTLAAILYLFGDLFVLYIFGEKYIGAFEVLAIAAISIPIYFQCYSSAAILSIRLNMQKKIGYMAIAALLNVGLNLVLIPEYGALGASIAMVVSYLFLGGAYYTAAKTYLNSEVIA